MADMDPQLAGDQTADEYDPAAVSYSYGGDEDDDAHMGGANGDEDDEEEYDPEAPPDLRSPSTESITLRESTTDATHDEASVPQSAATDADGAAAVAPAPAKPPRTKGGFVDESEDDEEDEGPVKAGSALLNAPAVSLSPKPERSATLSPSNAQNQQHNVSSLSAQNEVVPAGAVLPSALAVSDFVSQPPASNAATPAPDAPTKPAVPAAAAANLHAAPSARQSLAPTPVASSLPKPRLPQDRVGIFEDRIAEDPRGDIEAWLNLIDEHRKRHKYVEARAAYDEFFKVFPNAVRILLVRFFLCDSLR